MMHNNVLQEYTAGKQTFEIVNVRHACVEYEEIKLRMMMELGVPVAGIKIDKNKLTICEGVQVEGETENV